MKKINYSEVVKLARHADRPHSLDYINSIFTKFRELSGDRLFSDDMSVISGIGELEGKGYAIIGIEKGRTTAERITHNFGMPGPEGYRKALRVAELASRFSLPLITFVDTPGAYPGIEAEERGQAHAIADNIEKFFRLDVPILSYIIGEGGSGGALAIAVADRVVMLENSIYSVISPESCAAILYSDASKAPLASESLKLDSSKALELGVIDQIIEEPLGGAHKDTVGICRLVKESIIKNIKELSSVQNLKEQRFEKYRKMGNQFIEKK